MRNDYFVSKKPGRRSLNNYSTLHCIFIDVGCMSQWRCFIWITFTSSFPSTYTHARVYAPFRELPLTLNSLWLTSYFSAPLHSKTSPKTCLHNLPLSSMWVTTLANLTFSRLPSFCLTSQQQSTQLKKPFLWERFSSLAAVVPPLWAFLLLLKSLLTHLCQFHTLPIPTMSLCSRSQSAALFSVCSPQGLTSLNPSPVGW